MHDTHCGAGSIVCINVVISNYKCENAFQLIILHRIVSNRRVSEV